MDLSPLRKFINDEIDRAHLRKIDRYLAKRKAERRSFFEGAQWDEAESRQQAFYGALPPAWVSGLFAKRAAEVTGITDVMRGKSAPEPSPIDKALEDFVARRKAKRGIGGPTAPVKLPLRDCLGCGKPMAWTSADIDKHKKCCAQLTELHRAMSLPLSFTARMGMR